MRLDEKARENLQAAERLLPDEATREGLLNAAASRAYYAAYQAVADAAGRVGLPFTDNARAYYRHDLLPEDALRWDILDQNASEDLEFLQGLRVKADYHEDPVELEEASQAFEIAKRLVGDLVGAGA